MTESMVQGQLTQLLEEIIVIPDREARWFVAKYHYLHRALHMSQISYGLYRNGILDGVFTFGYPYLTKRMFGFHPLDYLEFARCVWMDKSDHNTGSRTIAAILRRVADDWLRKYPERTRPLLVVSYCDTSRHLGTLYRACNFIDTGTTIPSLKQSVSRQRIAYADSLTVKRRYIYPLTRSARRNLILSLEKRKERH